MSGAGGPLSTKCTALCNLVRLLSPDLQCRLATGTPSGHMDDVAEGPAVLKPCGALQQSSAARCQATSSAVHTQALILGQ